MPLNKHDHPISLETDERFVTGVWRGFYIQWGQRGKQELHLSFFDGQIVGDGADPAGDFRVLGTYDINAGKLWMQKLYASHNVEYDGHAEGDGVWGLWSINDGPHPDKGGFHIWPDCEGEHHAQTLEQHQPRPVISAHPHANAFSGMDWNSLGED